MSKATVAISEFLTTEGSLIGFKYPWFYLEVAPLMAQQFSENPKMLRPLVLIDVQVNDYGGHPLFRRMSRLYQVRFYHAGCWSGYILEADDRVPHQGNITWTEALEETRRYFTRGYRIWGETLPLLSIHNGGYSERICREIYAVRPHHDLQGRGDGK